MKVRKKPIVVEAEQWFPGKAVEGVTEDGKIHTLEGVMQAIPGDYIITGVRGEKYPCKEEIFNQSYEPA